MKPSLLLYPILALTPLCLRADVLTNGSFETNAGGGCNPTTFVTNGVGSNCITGWTVVSGNVDLISAVGLWDAEDGNYSIDMDGTTDGAIAQSFATVTGAEYTVTFWMAGNYAADPVVKTLEVAADGQSQIDTFNITGKSARNMGYVEETFNFVANGTTSTLKFASLDSPASDGGAALDNVTVAQVTPEPASLSLIALGLCGVAIASRGRKK